MNAPWQSWQPCGTGSCMHSSMIRDRRPHDPAGRLVASLVEKTSVMIGRPGKVSSPSTSDTHLTRSKRFWPRNDAHVLSKYRGLCISLQSNPTQHCTGCMPCSVCDDTNFFLIQEPCAFSPNKYSILQLADPS
jgi:hypothetical protein